ncbi:unannotated protein [freshwater metagenome]|uniref:Unannotated protein n=1 Tax=freshwater metagenome TaxID=449393 RepID=A0A6J7K0T5_9ZZZZ
MLEDGDIGRDCGGDALDAELAQCSQCAGDGGGTILAPADQLADEVVVVLADGVARLVATIPAGAETSGRNERADITG